MSLISSSRGVGVGGTKSRARRRRGQAVLGRRGVGAKVRRRWVTGASESRWAALGRRSVGVLIGAWITEVSRARVDRGRRSGGGQRPCVHCLKRRSSDDLSEKSPVPFLLWSLDEGGGRRKCREFMTGVGQGAKCGPEWSQKQV
jgi:hypothetical protein